MHAAGTLLRRPQLRLNGHVQLGVRAAATAASHGEHVHVVGGIFGMRIVARRLHVQDAREQDVGRLEHRHAHRNRAEAADLMLRRNRTLLPHGRRIAGAAVVNQREALPFGILEVERQPAVAFGHHSMRHV